MLPHFQRLKFQILRIVIFRCYLDACKKVHTVKPPNTADLGSGEKAAIFQKRRYWESYIT